MEKNINEAIFKYLDYIKKNALKYVGYGVSYDDLVQISCEAFIIATKNYKFKRNFKEYCNIYIHHYLNEAIVKANCIHSTGSAYYVDIFKILKAHKSGCVLIEEIQEKTSLSIDRIKECLKYIKRDLSIFDYEFVDTEDVEIEVINNLDDDCIIDKFFKNSFITEKEKIVLKMYFGFYGREYTLKEISEYLNISHQRVSCLKNDGIIKFRNFLLMMDLAQVYDFELEYKEIRKLKA